MSISKSAYQIKEGVEKFDELSEKQELLHDTIRQNRELLTALQNFDDSFSFQVQTMVDELEAETGRVQEELAGIPELTDRLTGWDV